jgi:MFS family permease
LPVLLKNKNYLLLTTAFTFLYGVYTSLGAVVSQLTEKYYPPENNAIFGATFILSGVLGSFAFGIALDKTQAYRKILRIINVGALCAIGISFYCLPSGSVPIFALNLFFAGIFVLPIIPISYSFAVELTFP